jgi:hypothetical protein
MIMRYFGGGIGHLKNTPPHQVHGFDPIGQCSEEMSVEDDDNDNCNNPCSGTGKCEDLHAINGELELGEDNDEDEGEGSDDSDEGEDRIEEDEDDESGYSSDEDSEEERRDDRS